MNLEEALDVAGRPFRWLPPLWRDDALQGARFEVWRRFYPAATELEVRGWARRGAIDELRRSTGWRRVERPEELTVPRDPTIAEDWPHDPDSDPADIAAAHLDAAAHLTELDTIDPRATAMLLARADGATLAAIGAAHGVSESRVCQILTIARRRINEVIR